MQSTEIQITALTVTQGCGQQVRWLRLTYPSLIAAETVTPESFQVTGCTVEEVFVNTRGLPGIREPFGRYVVLALSGGGNRATFEILHDVPHGRTVMRPVVAEVCQRLPLTTADGQEAAAWQAPRPCTCSTDLLAAPFRQFAWRDPASGELLTYNLFVPETRRAGEKYPLVLFLHDAGACSQSWQAGLAQGQGGVVWANADEQAKRPCFVLVPCYPRPIVEDDWSETWEVEATRRLVQHIIQMWPVDPARVYATGQSMGCMTLCALNSRYPGLFAASLLVAGQWDPTVTAPLKDCRLWVLVSEQDEKAFPGMKAVARSIENAGGSVRYGRLNAADPLEVQNREVERIAADEDPIIFTCFDGDSVLRAEPAGGHPHPKTWCCAYQIEALRAWLFRW